MAEAKPKPAILLTVQDRQDLMVFLERVSMSGREARTYYTLMQRIGSLQPKRVVLDADPVDMIVFEVQEGETDLLRSFFERTNLQGQESIAWVRLDTRLKATTEYSYPEEAKEETPVEGAEEQNPSSFPTEPAAPQPPE
jgi:hypothetical protein